MARTIRPCRRCGRRLFCNWAGHCDSCRKQLIAYGGPWAPMNPARRTIQGVVLAASLSVFSMAGGFAQTANPWDGTWKWGTFEERQANDLQWKAEVRQIAHDNCGQPYFGTLCDW